MQLHIISIQKFWSIVNDKNEFMESLIFDYKSLVSGSNKPSGFCKILSVLIP